MQRLVQRSLPRLSGGSFARRAGAFTLATSLLGIVGASTPALLAQAVSVNGGSIQGTITDASGAVVPGALIVLSGKDTGYSRTLKTDSSGVYSIGPINPGRYNLTVTAPGFQTLSVETVIRVGTATTGTYKLTIGSEATKVEVNAGAIQVNTNQPGVSDVITRDQIQSLPINGRNFLDIAQLQPGVILQSGETFDPTKAGYSAISVGGVSGRTTRILLDGQDITDETVGTTIMNVDEGAVDEFQLNRSTQDVSGEVTSTGQVLVATRSGTNDFHGELFYNFQDHTVGFARTTGGFDAPFQRNQFGGSLGGPIIKDKLYFFANSERIKQDEEGSATTSPTFSAIQSQYPFIPSPYRETYSTVRLDYNGPLNVHYFVRGAYNVNSSDSNFGDLYSLYNSRNNVPAIVGGADFATGRFTHSFRVGYEKFHNLLNGGTAGLTSIYNPTYTGGGSVTLADGGDSFYAGPNYLAPQGTYQSDKQFRYDGTWTKGVNTFKFGASLNRLLGGGFAAFFGPSLYTVFGQASAVNGGADPTAYSAEYYLIGNGNGFFTEKPGFGLKGGGLEDWRSGAYVADSIKVTPSFTAVAGLRWSVDTDRANQDLATPLCSSVDPSLQFAGCTGDTPLFDQFQAGLGKQTHQPYGNFGPQAGFVFSPGNQKTAVRGGIGIFYESDIFNNTSNARCSVVNANGDYFNDVQLCGGVNSIDIPGQGVVSSYNGESIATICNEPISIAAPKINAIKSEFQTASQTGGPNPAYIGTGGGLKAAGIYGAPYVTPYSIQFNGGLQHELAKGTVLTVDYVHNATLKIPLSIDVNHVGAARYLNVAAAKTAIAATLAKCGATSIANAAAPGGCPGGSGPNNNATISDFAAQGLDSSNQYTGGYAASAFGLATPAAFAGVNPNVGLGKFILPVGRSGYDALQIVFRQQATHPFPGVLNSNFQASYSLSRIVNPVAGSASGDQFFTSSPYDNDDPNKFLGRSGLDHTNELSFGGALAIKYGATIGIIGHFYSAAPNSLTLDNSSGATGEIFRTDVDGDGTTGDLLPGTGPGSYMHQVKGAGLNKFINSYNSANAGKPTPAGQALVSAGLLSLADLTALNGVQQQIALAPTTPVNNSAFRAFDVNVGYPVHLSRLREGMTLEPKVAMYNVFNMSNFSSNGLTGQLLNVTDAGGTVGSTNNYLNGPNDTAVENGIRTQRGSGTFAQGSPRTTEFQLRLAF
jgi:hypothetical protein